MTEKTPIGYRIKGAKAEFDEESGKYRAVSEPNNDEAIIERSKDGKILFLTEDEALKFCVVQMLYSAKVEPIY